MKIKTVGLFLGPILFFLILFVDAPKGMGEEAQAVLACTVWVALWWMTEALPIAATALLPIILFPLTGAASMETTTAAYGHPYIFLFVGGFIIAKAIEQWNLHKRIALNIIQLIGSNIGFIILGFMVATAFLSMWISNTATSVMMLPIGLAVIQQVGNSDQLTKSQRILFGKALMIAIAYSASIGGMATLIGTPPNLVFAGIMKETFQVEITFEKWLGIGLPFSILMLFICWKYLTRIAFPLKNLKLPGGKASIVQQLKALGSISYEEKMVAVVFGLTAIAWVTKSFLLGIIFPAINDTIIALMGAMLLFLIPSRSRMGALIKWNEAVKLPWGVLLLYGGGLAIAASFQTSGLATWIGTQMTVIQGLSLFLMIAIIVASVNFLTELTSNLATTAMLLPILASMAVALDIHPIIFMVSATLAASCAFMLPVATPPNAVVFGSGKLEIKDMVRAGIWMNLFSIALITLLIYFLLPYIWGI
ncbi:DASS family sodium-coupled anion symporter [Flavobacteriaceae bacterium F89]|uniref:DASS family sodium-coupled anion symporter n=1 Tax=Cerina litoralis TaxID=2874477 RepID=A0AAE3EW90_9FLAO|nr:DASS family sodium-coupled anion symporter [Cerina litoralis]MCG2462260.1 DASS family sodium-coupled anion symporter [Cerina litoralis]